MIYFGVKTAKVAQAVDFFMTALAVNHVFFVVVYEENLIIYSTNLFQRKLTKQKSKYCTMMQLGTKHCQDIYQFGLGSELCYDCAMIGYNVYNCQFCYDVIEQCQNLQYCFSCHSTSDCFGCYGLKRKKYCIFNKQYSKEEYFKLKQKLIEKMSNDGEYGAFLPPKYSPFAYNESSAMIWHPLSKQQALTAGYRWKDDLPHTTGKETLTDIPHAISEVDQSITSEILSCQYCQKNYKITAQELKFYQQHNIPIPLTCFGCRRNIRIQKRQPRYLYQRTCDQCGTDIISSYSDSVSETVLCEGCYLEQLG